MSAVEDLRNEKRELESKISAYEEVIEYYESVIPVLADEKANFKKTYKAAEDCNEEYDVYWQGNLRTKFDEDLKDLIDVAKDDNWKVLGSFKSACEETKGNLKSANLGFNARLAIVKPLLAAAEAVTD